jgi:hypothetical protein
VFRVRFLASALAVATVVLVPAGRSQAVTVSPQIRVTSCQVVSGIGLPLTDEIGLIVRFQSNTSEPLREIVWRAKYAKYSVDFSDDGTFSPGVQIDNYLLTEQGSTHLDWFGLANDLLAAVAKAPGTSPVTASSVTFPPYISSEEPENCSVLRTKSASGILWVNPELSQSPVRVVAQMASAATSAVAFATPKPVAMPIEFRHCSLDFEQRAYLHVTFRNTAPGTVDRIVVRTPYASGAIDFTDQGTYASGTWIDHRVKQVLPENERSRQYISLDDPAACSIVTVHFADGSTWTNPAAPELMPMPTPVPNAIVLTDRTRIRWSRSRGIPKVDPTPAATQTPAA